MSTPPFNGSTFDNTEQALDFFVNMLASSTEYAIIGQDLGGAILLWNEGARRLYGYDPHEVIGQANAAILSTPEAVAAGQPDAIMAAALCDGKWEGVVAGVDKNGTRIPVHTVVTPRRDRTGTPLGFLVISKNMGDENRTSAALAALVRQPVEEQLRVLLESAPDAMIIVNQAGKIVLVNAQTEKMFGYAGQEVRDQPVDILTPARYRTNHAAHRNTYFANPHLRPMGSGLELYGQRKDGTEFPIEISLSPLKTETVTLVLASIRDITDRHRAAEQFRALLESAPDAMVIVNQTGKIVLINSQTEKLFGYGRHELLGQSVEALVPADSRRQHLAHRTAYFAQPRTRPMGVGLELYGLHKNGLQFPIEISLSPLETEEGILVTAAIRDITERKRFETTLREKNLELENAILAKDRFLASMSHELRTPLNAVIGFTGTLLMKLPGPLTLEQEKQLRTIQSSAKHLLSLINDLLDLAKIESGKIELLLEAVDCRSMLEEVASLLRPLAAAKGIGFDLQLPEEEIVLRSDRRTLSQIVINLGNNAIKFTEQGEVSVELVQPPEDGCQSIEIKVIDTGIGIRPEDQTKLFQAFAQMGEDGKRREGSGLGLYLSQKLALLLGGQIKFQSEYGKGSTFTLRFGDQAGGTTQTDRNESVE